MRRQIAALPWLLVLVFGSQPARALAADKVLLGVGFDERLSGEAVLAEALHQVQLPLNGLRLSVRVVVDRAEIERRPGDYDFIALDSRVARYRDIEGLQIYLDLRDDQLRPEALDAWGQFARTMAARYRGVARGYVFGERDRGTPPLPREHAFFVKTTAVNLRTADPDAAMILGGIHGGDARWLAAVLLEDVAPYVDAFGLDGVENRADIVALVAQHAPNAGVVQLGESLGEVPAEGARRFLVRHLSVMGTRVSGVTYAATIPVAVAALGPVAALRGMLGQEMVSLDEQALGLRLIRAGEDVTAQVHHQLLFGLGSSTNYFIYSDPQGPVDLVLSDPTGTRPTIEDGLRGVQLPVRSFNYDSALRTATIGLVDAPGPLVVDWSGGNSAYTAREDVSTTVLPSVAEIIARHQQAQATQNGLLRSYVANANMEQHFRTTAIESGFDVMTENRFFVEGKNTEWEERSFRLNGTKWGPKRPPFPLLQAEKVLSLPLDLQLNTDYRYRLVGVETVEGRACFTLRFDPIDEDRTLYRGTVWIDRVTYLKAKAQTVQTRLSSPVLSSEEIQYFSPVGTVSGRDIHLLTRLVGRQIMLIAGRNLLVERGITFDAFQLNAADFAKQREAARASDHVMYRDTDEGLRYLVMQDGVRVVHTATTTATAGLMGITHDPSYD